MSEVKFSPDLFIGKVELERFKLFLDKNGWRQHFIQKMLSPGVIQNKYVDPSFQNGKVEVEDLVNFKVRIQQLKAIDKEGELISLNEIKKITIPLQDTWYWVKCSYLSTSIEKGTFSVDTQGNLTGSLSELTKILRGYPNFQQRIKFANATLNTDEYDIIEVTSDTSASLQGSGFQAETDLQLQVVGTFTPGAVVPDANKFPFKYDSCTIELVQESITNTAPSKITGKEFYLARIQGRIEGGSTYVIEIQDKRTENLLDNDVYKQIQLLANSIVGFEQIRWQNDFSNKNMNDVRVGWGVRSSTWGIDTTLNEVFLSNAEGGLIKDISAIVADQFTGWRLYSPKGTCATILSVTPSGGGLKCRLDKLIVDDFSADGGTTLYSQPIIIVPDAEEIEIVFSEVGKPNEYNYTFNINEKYGVCAVPVNSDTSTIYTVQYRFKNVADYTQFVNFADDSTNGYYNENQFDTNGNLNSSPAPTRTTYAGSQITLLTSSVGGFSAALLAMLLGFKEPILLNGFDVVDGGGNITISAGTAFINGKIVKAAAYSGPSNIYLNSAGNYVSTLPAGESVLFDPLTSQYFDDVLKRHTFKPYEVISIEQLEDDYFDGTGLGKWKWKKFAKCNGQNGTVDRRQIFDVGADPDEAEYNIGQIGGASEITLQPNQQGKIKLAVSLDDIGGGSESVIANIKINGQTPPRDGGSNQTSFGTEIEIDAQAAENPFDNKPPFKPIWKLMRLP